MESAFFAFCSTKDVYKRQVRIQSYNLCQKLPGPTDRFRLKIISKGEIAQHLKEGAVAGGLSDILDIACTDTLLAGTYPAPGRDLLAGKIEMCIRDRYWGRDSLSLLIITARGRRFPMATSTISPVR